MPRFLLLLLCAVLPPRLTAQAIRPVLLPVYMQGTSGTNSQRLPFVCRLRLEGLAPLSTYRYINLVVTSPDPPSASGAGNCIFVNPDGTFRRTSNPGLSAAGGYGELLTDSSGVYEGWFITEPTGNSRFTAGGNVFPRLLLNDGKGGGSVSVRLTCEDSAKILRLDTTLAGGTGVRGYCRESPMDFVFLYDDTSGAGRPLSGSFIESDGTENATANGYAPFYGSKVNGIPGAFGMYVPNNLPAGIRRIEYRSRSTGAIAEVEKDPDGVWEDLINTVHPRGGLSEIVLRELQADVPDRWSGERVPLRCWPVPSNGEVHFSFHLPEQGAHATLAIFDLLGREVTVLVNEWLPYGHHTARVDAGALATGPYVCRLSTEGDMLSVIFCLVR